MLYVSQAHLKGKFFKHIYIKGTYTVWNSSSIVFPISWLNSRKNTWTSACILVSSELWFCFLDFCVWCFCLALVLLPTLISVFLDFALFLFIYLCTMLDHVLDWSTFISILVTTWTILTNSRVLFSKRYTP